MLSLLAQDRRRFTRLGFLVCLVLLTALPLLPMVGLLDLKLLDGQFALERQLGARPVAQEVALIGIDEATYRVFDEPFALWHAHLGRLLEALATARPTAVGLDITLPGRSYNRVLPGSDQQLMRGMLSLRRVVPLVLGVTVEQDGNTRPVYPPFLSVAGEGGHAFVLWRLDPDRVVRRYDPTLGAGERTLPTLVGTLAMALGRETHPGLIDYSLGESINYIPMQQVLAWYDNEEWASLHEAFAGRAVLVGTVLPFEDRHYQPLNLAAWESDNSNFVPGVLIHVQALRTALADGFIPVAPRAFSFALAGLMALLWWTGRRMAMALSLAVAVVLLIIVGQTLLLGAGYYLPVAAPLLAALLAIGGRQGYEIALQMIERRRLRGAFAGSVSPQVLEEILNGHLTPGIHGERQNIAVLFSDIRGFTSISEKLEPEAVIAFLNRYLGAMSQAIQAHGGTVDKFIGDGIMAFFGAPKPDPAPARQAFAAARAKLERLEVLNREFAAEGNMPELRIGIGIHLGDAVVGHIGSEERNEYTAIGDVVNTASRLEGLTKQVGYPLVVSYAVADALKGEVELDPIGEMPVKGRAPVMVYGWPPKGSDNNKEPN